MDFYEKYENCPSGTKSKHCHEMTIMTSFEIAISPIDSWIGEIEASNNVLKAILSAHFDLEMPNFGRHRPKFGRKKPKFGRNHYFLYFRLRFSENLES